MDFLLYYTLIADATPVDPVHLPLLTKTVEVPASGGRDQERTKTKVIQQNTTLEASRLTPLSLSLVTDRGNRPVYRTGESARLTLNTSIDAHVYCYYQPRENQIVKIFPTGLRHSAKLLENAICRFLETIAFK